MQNRFKANTGLFSWSLLVILSIIWGTSFILIKRGLVVLTPWEVGSLRIVSASLFLLPFALKNLRKVSRRDRGLLAIVGMASIFMPSFLFAIAQTKLNSSLTGVFNALTPLWVLLIGVVFFHHIMNWRHAMGVLMGFIGSVLLIFSGSDGDFTQINFYALYVIAATILYGINLNLIKHYLGHLKATAITSVSVLIVSPVALGYLLFFTGYVDKMSVVQGFWEASFYILLLGVMSTGIALILFNKLVQITTPIFTSSVTYLIPVVAIGWGVWDGEALFLTHYAGIAIILGGVYLVNR